MPTPPIPIASYKADLVMNFYDVADVRTTGDAVIQIAGGNGSVNIPVAQGVQGFSVYGSTSLPTATSPTAVPNDLYIYAATTASGGVNPGDVLRKNGDGTWSVIGNVRGAKGDKGNPGDQGIPGPSSGIRAASDYDNTVAPAVGAVPAWNGTKYKPAQQGRIIARTRRTSNAVSTAASTAYTAQAVLGLSSVPVVGGRLYEVTAPNVAMYSTGGGTFGATVALAFITYAVNTGNPAFVSSPQLVQMVTLPNTNGQTLGAPVLGYYPASTSGTLSVLLCYYQPIAAGSLGVTMVGSGSSPIDLMIRDVGVDPGDTGTSY